MKDEREPEREAPSPPEARGEDRVGERPVGPAIVRGWRNRCPNCGGGPILRGYLTVRDRCPSCGEDLHHHRADDLPAWLTILVVGHLAVFGVLHVEIAYNPPIWVHWAVWPVATIGLTMWMLPRVKGAVVGLQWACRMHGFGSGKR